MKIVQIAHGFPPRGIGGTERYLEKITQGLRDRGHQLCVYAGSPDWQRSFHAETRLEDGIELTRVFRNDLYFDRWDRTFNPRVEEHFRDYLAKQRPDLIHLHQWIRLSSHLVRRAAEAGIPTVVTLHDFYTVCPRYFHVTQDGRLCDRAVSPEACRHCVDRWLFQQDGEIDQALAAYAAAGRSELACAGRVLAPSAWHAAQLGQLLGATAPEIEVLPLGRLSRLSPAPTPGPGEKFRIVYFSHLYPFKGPEVLIRAFKQCAHPEQAELHLFGGEVLPEFSASLKDLAQGFDVTFHGSYAPEDLQDFAMDLVVLPTLVPETYSLILDEASDLGVPVLASEVGALPERCGDRARLFRRGDAADLAAALDRAMTERPLSRTGPVSPMPMAEHLDRLERIYESTVTRIAAPLPPAPLLPLIKDQWQRREFGFRELIRAEQWEGLVASLRERISDLEKNLENR